MPHHETVYKGPNLDHKLTRTTPQPQQNHTTQHNAIQNTTITYKTQAKNINQRLKSQRHYNSTNYIGDT